MPPAHLLPDRLAAVLAVVYLIFNEGYGGRGDLAAEAIRLGRALAELMPDEPEVHGLLALMLMNDARREARFADGTRRPPRAIRTGRSGTPTQIAAGRAALERALALGGRGPYVLQAAIASLHLDEPAGLAASSRPSTASSPGSPARRWPSSTGPSRSPRRATSRPALALVESLELDRYHYLHATRAELLRRLDRADDARAAYDRALELVHSDAERAFLERRRAELQG